MEPETPAAPQESDVIRLAREAMDMTAQAAAEASRAHDGKGVSVTYWRDIERGYGGRRGQRVPTRASARALAAMARVVGVMPEQLTGAGRDDAARVLGEILRREGTPAEPPATPEPVTPDPGDDVTGAVVAALFGPKERKIWAHIRHKLASTPAGRALFADPAEAAAWPPEAPDGFSGGAPFDLTAEARQLLDATPAAELFADPNEVTVWRLDRLRYRKRVSMIREYREPVRGAGTARRAGLRKPDGLSA